MHSGLDEGNSEHRATAYASYIVLTDKGKIKWNGPFEILQQLMIELTGKDVLWSTPGSDCKMLKLSEVEIRWYANSKSLIINGEKKEEFKSQLRVLSNWLSLENTNTTEHNDQEACVNGLHTSQNIEGQTESSNPEVLVNIVQNLEEKVNKELNDFRSEIRDLKSLLQAGKTLSDEHNVGDNPNDHSLLAIREFLLKENACLKERNEKLNDELNNYKCISSDLNMRVKELENQNSSLTTVISLLSNEQRNICEKEPWKLVNNKRRSRTDERNNNVHYDEVELSLENRYVSLGESADDSINQRETMPGGCSQQRQQQQAQQQAQDQQKQYQQRRQQQHNRRNRNKQSEGNQQAQESQSGEQKRRIDIVGDSMLKGLKGHKMSRTDKVRVTTFSGCSTRDMFDYIKPTINRKPDQLIVHVGTNSLRDSPNPTTCAGEIIDLADSIKNALPTTGLVLSTLITRSDDVKLARQMGEVNKILSQHCDKKHWTVLEHSNITERHLNRSGLHLNKVGTTHLACNFIQCIQRNNK